MFDTYSGATRVYFIVGDPIAQVKSPAGVTEAMRARGVDAIMVPAHVRAADLGAFMQLAQRMPNCDGLCITIPHKFDARHFCATLTARAQSIGAVNVIRRNADGSWHGDMCDGEGYVAGLRARGCTLQGAAALLVGAGGAGSAIAHALVDAGVARLHIGDADAARCELLIAKLRAYGQTQIARGSESPLGFDIVLNATPCGMGADDPLPFDVAECEPHAFVGCVITQPTITPLIAAARARGHATMTGVDMFNAVRERLIAFYMETLSK
jgi:shikimate dehydrogenase